MKTLRRLLVAVAGPRRRRRRGARRARAGTTAATTAWAAPAATRSGPWSTPGRPPATAASKCKDCHGSSFSADLRMHAKNLAARVAARARRDARSRSTSATRTCAPLVERCGSCHRQERADWESGPHGAPYAAIFINPEHNANQQLMDDCLRCHAHALRGRHPRPRHPARPQGPVDVREGGVRRPARGALPRVPLRPPQGRAARRRAATAGSWPGPRRRSRGRRSPSTTGAPSSTSGLDRLPLPAMKDGDRPVKTSPDRRQALCYQCHAPRAGNQVFSGDDRTPVGVHEGLSCLACHAEARPDDARLVRRLPPAPLELRDRRGDDGHDLQVARQPARRPPGGVPRLPPEGRAEEAGGGGGQPRNARLEVDALLDDVVGAGPDLLEHRAQVLAEDPEEEQLGAADEAEDRQRHAPRRRRPLAQPTPRARRRRPARPRAETSRPASAAARSGARLKATTPPRPKRRFRPSEYFVRPARRAPARNAHGARREADPDEEAPQEQAALAEAALEDLHHAPRHQPEVGRPLVDRRVGDRALARR